MLSRIIYVRYGGQTRIIVYLAALVLRIAASSIISWCCSAIANLLSLNEPSSRIISPLCGACLRISCKLVRLKTTRLVKHLEQHARLTVDAAARTAEMAGSKPGSVPSCMAIAIANVHVP